MSVTSDLRPVRALVLLVAKKNIFVPKPSLFPFQVVSEMQKTETKNSKAKDIFEKVKTDVRLMKEELTTIERNQVRAYLQRFF